MSVNKLTDNFNKWNPMETDYRNAEFNQYVSGPGADLDEELQPAGQALGAKTKVPTLIFKNLPKELTKKGLYNICSRHGQVREVRDTKKNSFYFVDMVTVADMESVFRALENNDYGFTIMLSKSKEKTPTHLDLSKQNCPSIPPKKTGIDFERRTLHTSKKNPPRPKVKEDSSIEASDLTNNGLPTNLLTNDAHSLERQGLNKLNNNNKFSYRNGRSFVNIPEKSKEFFNKKHKESSGEYIEKDDKYLCIKEGTKVPDNIAKCSQCCNHSDTVCERCSQYYCSMECQKSDWQEHRYKCGKPKHLQKVPPAKNGKQAHNNSLELPKQKNNAAVDLETCKDITVKGISPKELTKSKKTIPRQLQLASKKKPQQLSNSQKISPQKHQNPSSSQPSITSKSSPKQLPAALRLSSQKNSGNTFDSSPTTSQDSSENSPNKSLEEYKKNMPRSGNIVTITAISKTNLVFIRSTTYEDNLSFINTVDTLQVIGKKLQPLKTLPKSGTVVITRFEEQFNRALILSASSPTKIIIHFMDFGNMEQARIEDLFEAPEEFIYKPRHAIPVVLKDVTDIYMTQEIRKFMHAYLNNINVEIRYKPEDFSVDNKVYAVELIDETTQQNLNKMIMKLAKPVEPQNVEEICDRSYLETIRLPVGENIEYLVTDNSVMCTGCISCTTKPYATEINKFKNDIQAYVESIPNEAYTPRVNELCIAQYVEDGLWYRGVCLETVGDGHPSIHFLDYGNITLLPIENIRRYPRQFTYPVYTADCVIEGLPEFCDDKIVEVLEELIPNGKLIKCDSVTVDEESNFYTLSIPNVLGELKKRGLINE